MNFLAAGKSGEAGSRSAILLNFHGNIFMASAEVFGPVPEGVLRGPGGASSDPRFSTRFLVAILVW